MLDAHAHLNFELFDADLDDVLARMKTVGVGQAIVVGTDIVSSEKALKLAEAHDELFVAVGLHPTDVPHKGDLTDLAAPYKSFAEHPKVVAIGEVGLDYYHIDHENTEAAKKAQWRALEQFIDLANEADLPVIFHSRQADTDMVRFLREHPLNCGGVMHCFASERAVAKHVLDLGFYLSFTAMLTYPKNEELRDVVKYAPPERVLIETDCPFLPPQDKRGERNEPAYVVETAKVVAEQWGKTIDYVDQMTTKNTQRLFHLP